MNMNLLINPILGIKKIAEISVIFFIKVLAIKQMILYNLNVVTALMREVADTRG